MQSMLLFSGYCELTFCHHIQKSDLLCHLACFILSCCCLLWVLMGEVSGFLGELQALVFWFFCFFVKMLCCLSGLFDLSFLGFVRLFVLGLDWLFDLEVDLLFLLFFTFLVISPFFCLFKMICLLDNCMWCLKFGQQSKEVTSIIDYLLIQDLG